MWIVLCTCHGMCEQAPEHTPDFCECRITSHASQILSIWDASDNKIIVKAA
jgi:hypothetical protein